jgi:Ca2+/Na+ antiporter
VPDPPTEAAEMIANLVLAFCLMALCVAIHALGLTAALRFVRRRLDSAQTFWRSTGVLIAIAGFTILVHLIEIAAWAMLYAWTRALPDLQSSFYFSAVTYTTVGYGDLVLPKDWRLVGGIEALIGILMCGWSTAFFFAVFSRMYRTQVDQDEE